MKLDEIVKAAREDNEAAFANISDKRAAKIIRAAFQQVTGQLESAEEGKLNIGSLGRFMIKNVEREKEGAKVTRRRVTFRPRGAGKKKQSGKAAGSDEGAKAS
jgi:nucleoid DNA-binding protein